MFQARKNMFNLLMLLLALVFLSTATQAAIEKGPYLTYNGTNTEMVVLWQLSSTRSCTLEWGTDTNYNDGDVQTTEFGTDHQHKYVITDLSVGTKYYYRVTANSNTYTGSFNTAPASSATNVKLFAHGDTRTNPGDHAQVCGAMISRYVADPAAQTLTLSVGDWVYNDTEANWSSSSHYFSRDYDDTMQLQAEVPMMGAIGNHEAYYANYGATFHKYFDYPYVASYYMSFDYGPAHVVIFNQYTSFNVGSAQYNWLDDDLANTTKPWKFILIHTPAYGMGGGHGNDGNWQTTIQPLCEQYDVDIVFAGDNHYYAHCEKNGVKHITTGGGGAPLYTPDTGSYPNSDYLYFASEKTLHFCEIDIQGTTLTLRAINTSGQVIDTFQLIKELGPPGQAYNPDPDDNATNVNPSKVLSWTRGASTVSHDVYFGTDSPPPFIQNQAEATYNPGTMPEDTIHYWQIDEVNAYGTTTGTEWSFTTGTASAPNGWWKLDETTGTTASDSSGSGYNGTLVGGVTFNNDSVTGVYGGALDLDGTDDSISLPALNLNSNTVTITAWIKRNGTPSSWNGIVFSRGGSTAAGLTFGNSTELRYNWNDGTWSWDSGLNVPNDQWTFVALVVEPTKATIYMDDGTFQSATNTVSHAIEEFDSTTHIGWDSNWSDRRFDGAVDDVRVYPAALSSGEIQDVRDNGGGEPDTDPPTPDPATFSSPPSADSSSAISMTATTGTDATGPVYYYFDETSGENGATDSEWQTSPDYTDDGLDASTQYTYTVQMRDSASTPNVGTVSSPANATTDTVDTDPPTPTTATWASAPSADSSSAISMTATTGTDATGPVYYYFDETSGENGGTDSEWQTSPDYTDDGLDADTQYTYTVQMRDSVSPTPNVGTVSSPANATTDAQADDTVTITKAEYKADKSELKVVAISSDQPSVTLTVVGYGTMTWKNDKYEYKGKPVSDPGSTITVTSSGGGQDTASVTQK